MPRPVLHALALASLALAGCNPFAGPTSPSGNFAVDPAAIAPAASAAPSGEPATPAPPSYPGSVVTIAGGDEEGLVDGPGAQARFNGPSGLAIGGDGALYVSDSGNHRIRRIDLKDPAFRVSTAAGGGDVLPKDGKFVDGPGWQARFFEPAEIVAAKDGSLFIADRFNHRIRRLVINADGSFTVLTVAGNDAETGQDGAGQAASFRVPHGLAFDGQGNLWVTDSWGQNVRKITDPTDKIVVSTVAGAFGEADYRDGTGPAARFEFPTGIAFDPRGFMVVAEQTGCHLRRIDVATGEVLTLNGLERTACGYLDGNLDNATVNYPASLAAWPGSGFAMLLADEGNRVVRKLTITTSAGDGTVETFAGSDSGQEDGALRLASFLKPRALCVAADGAVYVADAHRIRRLKP